MVFIIDEGSVFDSPLDKIWRYMETADGDEHVHRSMTNVQMEMEGDNPVMTFETPAPGGMKATNKMRITMFVPVGILMEYLEGPLAGSKVMQYYKPMGNRTGITVVGEYTSKMMQGDQLKGMVMQNLEQAFNEDQANLLKFK
jgi:hypothetical protein